MFSNENMFCYLLYSLSNENIICPAIEETLPEVPIIYIGM